jgi:hypothetical protein
MKIREGGKERWAENIELRNFLPTSWFENPLHTNRPCNLHPLLCPDERNLAHGGLYLRSLCEFCLLRLSLSSGQSVTTAPHFDIYRSGLSRSLSLSCFGSSDLWCENRGRHVYVTHNSRTAKRASRCIKDEGKSYSRFITKINTLILRPTPHPPKHTSISQPSHPRQFVFCPIS